VSGGGNKMICAVCGYPLEAFIQQEPPYEESYGHLRPWEADDHIPVPVPRGTLPNASRCDFCDRDGPTPWLILADSFVDPVFGYESDGHWGACETCGPLVKRRRWTEIYARLMETESTRPIEQRPRFLGRRAMTMEWWGRLEVHMHGVVPYREELTT